MARSAILIALALSGCVGGPAALGITGPGTSAPASFTEPPPDPDSAVSLPGIPDSGGPYSQSNRPAGETVRPGGFYGYN
jgi:hypothetical protein